MPASLAKKARFARLRAFVRSCCRAFLLSCGSERALRAFQVSNLEFEILNLFRIWNFEFPLTAESRQR